MIVVFGAFMFSPDRMLKQFGLGLAVAIFIDAAIIRSLILPAVMQLFGTRAWWLPRGIGRMLPRVALEQPSDHTHLVTGSAAGAGGATGPTHRSEP